MKNLHRRVIEFTYFGGDLPMFETDQQAQEWYAAVGRLVAYGLHGQKDIGYDTVDLVQVQVRNKKEMTACYYKPEQARNADEDGYTDYDKPQPERELGDYVLRVSVRVDPPFVRGAVMSGGKWGFHS